MGKGIRSNNGLIGLHHHTGNLADQTAAFRNLLCLDARIRIIKIFSGPETHGNFF